MSYFAMFSLRFRTLPVCIASLCPVSRPCTYLLSWRSVHQFVNTATFIRIDKVTHSCRIAEMEVEMEMESKFISAPRVAESGGEWKGRTDRKSYRKKSVVDQFFKLRADLTSVL